MSIFTAFSLNFAFAFFIKFHEIQCREKLQGKPPQRIKLLGKKHLETVYDSSLFKNHLLSLKLFIYSIVKVTRKLLAFRIFCSIIKSASVIRSVSSRTKIG